MREALSNAGVNPDDYMREMGEEESVDLVIDTDIAIIGAGGAGMTAALTASDAGRSVLVLESQPAVGGNSVKSTGGMNAAKTEYQDANEFGESAGIEKTLKAAEGYADNDTESTELSEGYPVYPVTWMIGDGIPVIPYYEETDLRDRVYSHLASDEHGVWLSFRANEKTRTMIQLMPQTDFTFIIKGDGLHTQQLPVNGVLKQGVRSYMLEDNEMYIAVWHDDYEAMCKGEPIGRIVYYDSYEELVQAKEQFEAEGYTVNDEASSYEHVLEITAVQQTFYERIRIILLSISVLLLTGIHIFSVSRRIREYTILRMNGIPASCISKMICMEQVPACAVTFGLGMILSVILYGMGIVYLPSFLLCCGIMAVIELVILLGNTMYFRFYSMDRVLRD